MIAFWIGATVMAAVALAFIVPRLLRGAGPAGTGEARRKLKSLAKARADGHLSEDEYQRRRHQLAATTLPDSVDSPPAPGARAPATAYLLLVLTPLAAVALYLLVGEPRAILAPTAQPPHAAAAGADSDQAQAPELGEAITQLAARLAQNPNDVDGWFLLGRSYMAVQRHSDARAAFGRALELAPDEPVLMVEYAESIAFASGEARLPAEAEAVLTEALARQPDSQKALWLLGIGAYQRQDFRTALDYWQRLEGLVEPGGAVAEQIAGQIAQARAALGEPEAEAPVALAEEPAPPETPVAPAEAPPGAAPAPDDADESAAPSATGGPTSLTIEVSLAEELRGRVDPTDTLFVFARAVTGPRVPLAIQRLPAGSLPARVRLDSTMGMMPNMNLATFPEVIIGARISKSGNAAAQPGDLEALSDPVSSRSAEAVRLHIDKAL